MTRRVGDPVVMHAAGVVVVDTKYATPRGEPPYFQITLAADHERETPRTVVVTRVQDVYARALDAEGSPTKFDAAWRYRKRANGRLCLELTELTPALEEFTGKD